MATKKSKRDRDKEMYWRAALARHVSPGVSANEFCRREGLNPNTYQYRFRHEKFHNSAGGMYSRATRSPTVGIPSMRVPPADFGISSLRTGGGKYVPDDIMSN
jgi:hypothetical protein